MSALPESLQYLLARLVTTVAVVAGAIVLLFALTLLVPGNPAQVLLGPRATPEMIAEFAQRMGLDRPLWERLLRFFDKIRFFPVSADELLEARAAFPHGQYEIKIEEDEFSYADYARQLASDRESIALFKTKQQAAFDAERQRWKDLKIDETPPDTGASFAPVDDIPEGHSGAFRKSREMSGRSSPRKGPMLFPAMFLQLSSP